MHKITFTQNSTGKQMDYMRDNLRERYKANINIQRLTTGFKDGGNKTKYWIHIAYVWFSFEDTWKDLQSKYLELM
jgi:hypothetical protein